MTIEPAPALTRFELLERGEIRRRQGTVILARLPRGIADREVQHLAHQTGWDPSCFEIQEVDSMGPGNAVLLELESEAVTEIFTAFGEIGVRAEAVAERAVQEMRRYLKAGVPVGEHLADQLLLLLALAGSGAFMTVPLSLHALTQIELIPRFLDVRIGVEREARERCLVKVSA